MNRFWRCSSAVIASILLITTTGCKMNEKETVLEISESAPVGSSEVSEAESTEIVTSTETFGYADYIDETVPCKNIELSYEDIEALRDYDLLYYGSYYIGFGNPYLLSRQYVMTPDL